MNLPIVITKIKIIIQESHFSRYLIFAGINAVVSVCTLVLLAKYLSPEEFGKFGILMTVVYFTPSLISFSTDSLQAINIVKLDKSKYEKFRNEYISFVLCLFLGYLFLSFFSIWNIFYFKIAVIALIIGFLQWLSSIHNNELLQKRESMIYGILNLVNSVVLLLLSFFLLVFIDNKWEVRGIALVITELILVFFRIFFVSDIYSKFEFTINKKLFYSFIVFGSPLLIACIPGWILNQFDKYIVLYWFDLKIVGYYSFAASMSGIIVLISQSLQKSLRPILYDELHLKGNIIKYRINIIRYSMLIIVFSIIIGISLVLLFDHLPDFKYTKSKYLVFIALVGQAFFSIYSLLVMVLEYFKENKLKSIIIWQSAILFVGINFLFKGSYYIPAIASLVSFMYMSFKTYANIKKYI